MCVGKNTFSLWHAIELAQWPPYHVEPCKWPFGPDASANAVHRLLSMLRVSCGAWSRAG